MRRRSERGAAALETAMVVPLIVVLMATATAFGINELGNTVGVSAARDGARAGVLAYANANNPDSPDYSTIRNAVLAGLAGTVLGTPTVAVTCVHSDGTAVDGTGSCDPSAVTPGSDQIQVAVSFIRRAGSPFGSGGAQTELSRMTIVGTPPATTTPPVGSGCQLTGATVSPTGALVGGGQLNQDVTVWVTTNGLANCGIPTVSAQFADYGNQGRAQAMAVSTGTTYSYTYYHDVGTWTAGTKSVQIGATGAAAQSVSFSVGPVPPPCTLIVSPLAGTVSLNHGSVKHNGDLLITATVSGPLCGIPTLICLPLLAGGLDVVTPMIPDGTNKYTFDVGVDGLSSSPWTTGLKSLTVVALGASVIVRVTAS